MYTVLAILIIIAALLMIGVVLLQPGKGDLTATFGGLSSQFGQVFGMQRANNLLGTITKWIAAIILILIIAVNKFFVTPEVQMQQAKPVTEGAKVPTEQVNPNLMPPPVTPEPGQQPNQ